MVFLFFLFLFMIFFFLFLFFLLLFFYFLFFLLFLLIFLLLFFLLLLPFVGSNATIHAVESLTLLEEASSVAEFPHFVALLNSKKNPNPVSFQMKLLSLGYWVTNVSLVIARAEQHVASLASSASSASSSASFLAGEGNALLRLLALVERYVWFKTHLLDADFWTTSAPRYGRLLDATLTLPAGYVVPDVTGVVRLVQNQAALLDAVGRSSSSSSSDDDDALGLDLTGHAPFLRL